MTDSDEPDIEAKSAHERIDKLEGLLKQAGTLIHSHDLDKHDSEFDELLTDIEAMLSQREDGE